MEDRPEYISRLGEQEAARMQRQPFGVVALVNPRLTPLGAEGARFFEGCLSVPGYQVRGPRGTSQCTWGSPRCLHWT